MRGISDTFLVSSGQEEKLGMRGISDVTFLASSGQG